MKNQTVLQYLISLRPAIPFSTTECRPMSNMELRRACSQSAVLINGETVTHEEKMDFPVFSLVFFPKGKRRTTLV